MTRHGYPVRVRSKRRRGGFDWLERLEILPRLRMAIEAGDTDVQIARDLGICDRTVARYRHEWGYTNPRSPKRTSRS